MIILWITHIHILYIVRVCVFTVNDTQKRGMNDMFLIRLLDLSAALRYENVDMDSCLLHERPRRVILPDDVEAEPTPDPAARPLTPDPAEPDAITAHSTSVS